jgi:hypothetical protein
VGMDQLQCFIYGMSQYSQSCIIKLCSKKNVLHNRALRSETVIKAQKHNFHFQHLSFPDVQTRHIETDCKKYISLLCVPRTRNLCILYIASKVKVKVKFTLELPTEAQKGSSGIAVLFL